MNIVIRADASLGMGTGHVMRCLTLADALRDKGSHISFITRSHAGNLATLIKDKGYSIFELPLMDKNNSPVEKYQLYHAHLLGATQQQDADACVAILKHLNTDWLIVDHYGLDSHWEKQLRQYVSKIMVIDDLADREHRCDILLDQNLGRNPTDYTSLVPEFCEVITGPQYALLRPEFARLREYSLQRRAGLPFSRLLIAMGGVDPDNVTYKILGLLKTCSLPSDCQIVVVLGANAPWIKMVQEQANQMPYSTKVLVNVNNMAQQMADSDFSIGAAGSTSWERCCLGLPSIVICLAENQAKVIDELEKNKISLALDVKILASEQSAEILQASLESLKCDLYLYIETSASVTDGLGAEKVAQQLSQHLM